MRFPFFFTVLRPSLRVFFFFSLIFFFWLGFFSGDPFPLRPTWQFNSGYAALGVQSARFPFSGTLQICPRIDNRLPLALYLHDPFSLRNCGTGEVSKFLRRSPVVCFRVYVLPSYSPCDVRGRAQDLTPSQTGCSLPAFPPMFV